MKFFLYLVLPLCAGCAHLIAGKAPQPETSRRDIAFFSLFSDKTPSKTARNKIPSSLFPSSLSPEDNRDMALFYNQWAGQFKEAVQNYQSAIDQYKEVVTHFEKMSEQTKNRRDEPFFTNFKQVESRLKAADGFLKRAKQLRTTKPSGLQSTNRSAH